METPALVPGKLIIFFKATFSRKDKKFNFYRHRYQELGTSGYIQHGIKEIHTPSRRLRNSEKDKQTNQLLPNFAWLSMLWYRPTDITAGGIYWTMRPSTVTKNIYTLSTPVSVASRAISGLHISMFSDLTTNTFLANRQGLNSTSQLHRHVKNLSGTSEITFIDPALYPIPTNEVDPTFWAKPENNVIKNNNVMYMNIDASNPSVAAQGGFVTPSQFWRRYCVGGGYFLYDSPNRQVQRLGFPNDTITAENAKDWSWRR